MEIQQAKLNQINEIMDMYASARVFMAEHGNPNQWGSNYPEETIIQEDLETKNLYVCMEHQEILAVFFYKQGEDATYQEIFEGAWLDDAPYGVVHRITSSGKGKGAASFCLKWALEQCQNIRIDTHRDNKVMQNMLRKNGFEYCGIIYLENGDERLAYQKKTLTYRQRK